MTTIANAMSWAAAGATVGVLHARALWLQVSTTARQPLVIAARVALVCTFGFLAVRARASLAFGGWALAYAATIATFVRRLRRTT